MFDEFSAWLESLDRFHYWAFNVLVVIWCAAIGFSLVGVFR